MQDAVPTSPLQLLFIELRVGLARSAIQAGLLLNGGGAVALLLFLATILTASGQRSHTVELVPLKWALALFGLGMFLAGMSECLYCPRRHRIRPFQRVRQCHA